MSTDKQKHEHIRARYIVLEEKQIMKDTQGDVRDARKELVEAEKQFKLLQTMIAKDKKKIAGDRQTKNARWRGRSPRLLSFEKD